MPKSRTAQLRGQPPRSPKGRSSYSEQVDEAPKLLEDEPVEIERELPAEDNSPVERAEHARRPAPPLFEE